MTDEKEVERGMVTLRIIWMAMLAALAVYIIVGLVAAPGVPSSLSDESLRMLRTALAAVGLVTLLAVGYVRRLIWGGRSRPGGADQASRPPALQRYTAAVIVSLGLCESVGIYGLVLFLLGKNPADLFLFIGISAVAMYYYRPKREDLAG